MAWAEADGAHRSERCLTCHTGGKGRVPEKQFGKYGIILSAVHNGTQTHVYKNVATAQVTVFAGVI